MMKRSARIQKECGLLKRTKEYFEYSNYLLWLFVKRIFDNHPRLNVNPRKATVDAYYDLLTLTKDLSDKNKTLNYQELMTDLADELNIFINGDKYPNTSWGSYHGFEIQDPDYLDVVADVFGDLDGIVGFILAGNANCSSKLLNDLQKSDYYSIIHGSTRERVKKIRESNLE